MSLRYNNEEMSPYCWIGYSNNTINDFINLMKNLNSLVLNNSSNLYKICKSEIYKFLENINPPHFKENTIILSEDEVLSFDTRNSFSNSAIWVIGSLSNLKDKINNRDFTFNIGRLEPRKDKNISEINKINWIPVFGIVSCPFSNMIYWGCENIGSFQISPNDKINRIGIKPTKKNDKKFSSILKRRKIRISGSEILSHDTFKFIVNNFTNDYEIIKSNNTIKMINIFLKKTDIYPCLNNSSEFDICAATAIGINCGFNIKKYNKFISLDNLDYLENLEFNKENLYNRYFIVY